MSAPAAVRTAITGVGLAVAGPDFDPVTALAVRGMRHKDRSSRFAVQVARRTLDDAGLLGAPELDGAAVVVSSNFGNLDAVCDSVTTIATGCSRDVSPMRVPHLSSAVSAAWIALDHGIRGPSLTLCNGASGGLDAVAAARNLIAAGRATAALVIGVEPDTPPVARLHRESAGTRWIDGAVGLVIEPVRHAVSRGARIRAEIAGYGRAADEQSAVRAAGATAIRRLDADPTARFGRCSGALGVVQCAMAVEQLEGEAVARQSARPVLAVAGAGAGESDGTSVSALVLTPPREPVHTSPQVPVHTPSQVPVHTPSQVPVRTPPRGPLHTPPPRGRDT
ncbi:beta-ketoacyl synthase N-terminal-like domain-containing protein [Streptomyces aureocirculatus]|uniref:beta-ketoacyl synthase N-terminal-like domain-containing protein n=1 Tax=Streptomyces aureocirculatus TaxID=67275 RepID=UPI0012FE827F|nr:beta-ketoacyl synthase N-terminal-like domain-containing protein [Streptomyces aureocirculatus]